MEQMVNNTKAKGTHEIWSFVHFGFEEVALAQTFVG
jgi:hypothetical protein